MAICIGIPLPLRLYLPSYGIRVSHGTFMNTKIAVPTQAKNPATQRNFIYF
jgi:hypothetical protein